MKLFLKALLSLALWSTQAAAQNYNLNKLDIKKINKTILELTKEVLKSTDAVNSLDFKFTEDTDLNVPSVTGVFSAGTDQTVWSDKDTNVNLNFSVEAYKTADAETKTHLKGYLDLGLNSEIHKLVKYIINIEEDLCGYAPSKDSGVLTEICTDFVKSVDKSTNFDQQLTALVQFFLNTNSKAPKELKRIIEALKTETDEEKIEELEYQKANIEELIQFIEATDYTETSDPRTGLLVIDLNALFPEDGFFSKGSKASLEISLSATKVSAKLIFDVEVEDETYAFFQDFLTQYLQALEQSDEDVKEELKSYIIDLVNIIQVGLKE